MIELVALQKVIDQNLVVDIESLTVNKGEIAALVSPADSGKKNLLELLVGKSRPTVGTIRLASIDPHADRETFSQRVGVVLGEDSLYKRRSPLANLTFHCRLYGLPHARAQEMLTQVGLGDQSNAKTETLAPGLARRLAFGRAILHKPQVLLLITPFARCDEASISLLSRLMRDLAGEGTALLILADDTSHLTELCDVIYTMNQGRIVETFLPQEDQDTSLPFKIPVRMQGRIALVNPADILFVEAQDGRAFLRTTDERLPTQFTLTEMEDRLSGSGFFRAHRGYLVNLQRVIEVIPYTRNSFTLLLDDSENTEIPLSKLAAAELRERLGY